MDRVATSLVRLRVPGLAAVTVVAPVGVLLLVRGHDLLGPVLVAGADLLVGLATVLLGALGHGREPAASVRVPLAASLVVQVVAGATIVAAGTDEAPNGLVLTALAGLVVVGLWLLGVLVGLLVAVPLAAIGVGLATTARGDRRGGCAVAGLGLWLLSIGLYPAFLGLAADGPGRSLGLPLLLGVDSSGWDVHDPGLLWPARAFAVLALGPLLALAGVVLWAVVPVVARSGRGSGPAPGPGPRRRPGGRPGDQ